MEIKFSHIYHLKMPDEALLGFPTLLFAVLPYEDGCLSNEMLIYDTEYEEHGKINYYPLPKGKKLLLILATQAKDSTPKNPHYKIWHTIRRWTPEKESYYKAHLGEESTITITTDKVIK